MTPLAEFVAREQGVGLDAIMLLRHSSGTIRRLRQLGGTVEDYTVVQPVDSKYDYRHSRKPPVDVVVVIVEDIVDSVYRIEGVEAEGTNFDLETDAMRELNVARGRRPVAARRFGLSPLGSAAIGMPVSGWKGRQRTPVQRVDGEFFLEVQVQADAAVPSAEAVARAFEAGVARSRRSTREQRLRRLETAPKIPARVQATTTVYLRNADVVAEVLERADGRCELCGAQAPFLRRADATPYLEVHHLVRLAVGGEDTIANARAVCPNCHRREHFA